MTMAKPTPPCSLLLERLSYDQETGFLTWKETSGSGRNRHANEKASCLKHGYLYIKFDGVRYPAHRVIWKMMTGEDAPCQIDHINRDKTNNKWKNLRSVTAKQNCENRRNGFGSNALGPRQPRKSGFRGVTIIRNRFYARLKVGERVLGLGFHLTAESAYAAYVEAARKHYGDKARV